MIVLDNIEKGKESVKLLVLKKEMLILFILITV